MFFRVDFLYVYNPDYSVSGFNSIILCGSYQDFYMCIIIIKKFFTIKKKYDKIISKITERKGKK